jgi:hypothetical protein
MFSSGRKMRQLVLI